MGPPAKDVEVIQVVRTTLSHRGSGTEENPHRRIEQFWTLDGRLLAENDPCAEEPAWDVERGRLIGHGTARHS